MALGQKARDLGPTVINASSGGADDADSGAAATIAAYSKMASGQPQQMLVVFCISAADESQAADGGSGGTLKAIAGMQLLSSLGRGSSSREARVAAHAAVKARVFPDGVTGGGGSSGTFPQQQDTQLIHDFEQLPVSVVAVNSTFALDALLADPNVAAVVPDRLNRRMLAQSLPLIGQPAASAKGFRGAGCAVAVLDTGRRPLRAEDCRFALRLPASLCDENPLVHEVLRSWQSSGTCRSKNFMQSQRLELTPCAASPNWPVTSRG